MQEKYDIEKEEVNIHTLLDKKPFCCRQMKANLYFQLLIVVHKR